VGRVSCELTASLGSLITDFFFFVWGAEGDTTPRGALVLAAFGVGGISRYFRSSLLTPFQGRQMSLIMVNSAGTEL
jgi:hypothetical protein